jgi:solute:Na+ symporter, SSS family
MHWIDWTVIVLFLISNIALGLYFSHLAGKNVDSYFVSGRTLTWYLAGVSMIATAFAADTPLWVGALVRQYGMQAVWQYWSPLIGCALAVALFARMWRRTEVITDNELLEMRYDGKSAQTLRGISASVGALIICPLIIGWVAKAMVTIAKETMGIGGQQWMIAGFSLPSEVVVTMIVMGCALLICAFSGLYGVVYTDFVQFIIATLGTFILAWLSVREVGGLGAMVEKLSSSTAWPGHELHMAPVISFGVTAGGNTGTMSIWNVIGFFAILWWGNALCGGFQAQRVLACKDTEHASKALLLHTIVYFAIICWPWIIVALASIIIFPDMGAAGHDAAYPRMLVHILPIGLRGLVVSALIAAFISCISTLFNWGSSYIVSDLYRRFLHPNASDKHYVRVSRFVTVLVAMAGGAISFYADNIQQLLEIFYVVGGGAMVVGACRWFWWRINATGEIAAFVANWVVAVLLIFGHRILHMEAPLLDGPMRALLHLPEGVSFTNDYDLLGARMLFMMIIGFGTVVVVSLCTPPVDKIHLQAFVRRTRIFRHGWGAVIRDMEGYVPAQTVPQVLMDWAMVVATVCALLFSIAYLVRNQPGPATGLFIAFVILLVWFLRRTRRELASELHPDSSLPPSLTKL